MQECLFRSAQTSLRMYSPDPYDPQHGSGPGGWDHLAKKWNKTTLQADFPLNMLTPAVLKTQALVYRALHHWRDQAAREEDESTRYVLPNHFLFTLAESPPADMAGLVGVFKGQVPGVVKKRARELLEVVKEAVRRALKVKEDVEEVKEEDAKMVVEEMVEEVREVQVEKDMGIWGINGPFL